MVALDPGLALIFDMDGVLLDSNPMHGREWVAYLEQLGIPPDGIEIWMQGKRNDQIVRRLFGETLTEHEVFAHGARKEKLYREHMSPDIEQHVMPGLRCLLEETRGHKVGLGSNAERPNIEMLLEHSELRSYFAAVVDGHQAPKPKPAPDIYLMVCEQLGMRPENAVIFEDSPSGIAAARGAGAHVVGLCRAGRTLEGADLSIRDFDDPALRPFLSALKTI